MMTIAPSLSKTCTVEDYLAVEVASDVRNEYRQGVTVPMTGGTPEHNKLVSAINALLWFALRGKPYSVFVTDQRLWVPNKDLYTYPDVMVIANPVELKPGRNDTVINPVLIAEVLSDSTEAYDRGDKFIAYRTIPSLQEYWLINQKTARVEQFVKQSENQWLLTTYSELEAEIQLRSVPAIITLSDLYENVLVSSADVNEPE